MFKLIQKAKRNEKGFTLVELMVVVVIIGVLVAIAVPVYNGVQATARVNAHNANVRTLEGAAAMYLTEEGPPAGPANLVINAASAGALVPTYLQAFPTVNPIEGGAAYVVTITPLGVITVTPPRQ